MDAALYAYLVSIYDRAPLTDCYDFFMGLLGHVTPSSGWVSSPEANVGEQERVSTYTIFNRKLKETRQMLGLDPVADIKSNDAAVSDKVEAGSIEEDRSNKVDSELSTLHPMNMLNSVSV